MKSDFFTGFRQSLFILYCILMLFPFFCMIAVSFQKTYNNGFTFVNYLPVFTHMPLARFYANSLFIAAVQTLLQICISIPAAFAFSRLKFTAKRFCFSLVKVSLFVPGMVTLIPLFFLTSALGWIDTYAGLIFPQIFCALTAIMLTVCFDAVPQEYTDMGLLDGCNTFQLLYYLMIPQAAAGISAAAVFAFFLHWKSYFWPLIVTVSTDKRTLLVGMKYLIQEAAHEYHVLSAAAVIIIAPVAIALLVFSKKLSGLQRMVLQ